MASLQNKSMYELLEMYRQQFGEPMPTEPDLSTEQQIKDAAIHAIITNKKRKQVFNDEIVL